MKYDRLRMPACTCLEDLPERLAAVGLAECIAARLHNPVQLGEGAIAVADCPLNLQHAPSQTSNRYACIAIKPVQRNLNGMAFSSYQQDMLHLMIF